MKVGKVYNGCYYFINGFTGLNHEMKRYNSLWVWLTAVNIINTYVTNITEP